VLSGRAYEHRSQGLGSWGRAMGFSPSHPGTCRVARVVREVQREVLPDLGTSQEMADTRSRHLTDLAGGDESTARMVTDPGPDPASVGMDWLSWHQIVAGDPRQQLVVQIRPSLGVAIGPICELRGRLAPVRTARSCRIEAKPSDDHETPTPPPTLERCGADTKLLGLPCDLVPTTHYPSEE